MSGDNGMCVENLVTLARLALAGSPQDVATHVRRVAREHRPRFPEQATALEELAKRAPNGSPVRSVMTAPPVDADTRLELLRREDPTGVNEPVWSEDLAGTLRQMIAERSRVADLSAAGLVPTRSALFTGPPGVGKTLSARWIASELGWPLFALDLSAVMSSFLGRTGGNLRSVLDFARARPCVLLLDEFDAIAKRRDDSVEIGELKRLVTVLLQEIETWPATGLLIAATNHPELLDPAVWRRFDVVVRFGLPALAEMRAAVGRLLRGEATPEAVTALSATFAGHSFSDAEREVSTARRESLVKRLDLFDVLAARARDRVRGMSVSGRKRVALAMVDAG